MDIFILLAFSGLGLGALYFLVASGLSLIYGLMHVLNFAHGVFLTLGGYVGWEIAKLIGVTEWSGFLAACLAGMLAGALFATLTELLLIRSLYERHLEQVLVTMGLGFAAVAIFQGAWGPDAINTVAPAWLRQTTNIMGAQISNLIWVLIGVALLLLLGIQAFLRYTRYGMIIRAGVENRSMVTALGIDVRQAFTLVFAVGGAAAGLGGVLAMHHFNYVSPYIGTNLLIFAFIVTVIGGLGSIPGAAIASVLVALIQQFINFYAGGLGDIAVVLLLALVLLVRPAGLLGKAA